MSLINEVERILSNLAQEGEKEASVLVQFAAGDWAALKQAFADETAQATPVAVSAPKASKKATPVVDAPVVDAPVVESTPVDAPTVAS